MTTVHSVLVTACMAENLPVQFGIDVANGLSSKAIQAFNADYITGTLKLQEMVRKKASHHRELTNMIYEGTDHDHKDFRSQLPPG